MKKNESVLTDEAVVNKIYFMRGNKVMLDKDLAELYQVTTGNLNKAVKRNLKRFPDDFMFQLNKKEFENLIFQIGISSWGGTRNLPYVFTEQGVAMLSGILHSDRAILVNIHIMRVFTKIRQMIMENTEVRLQMEKLEKKTDNNTKNIEVLFRYFDELIEKDQKPRKKIGYKV